MFHLKLVLVHATPLAILIFSLDFEISKEPNEFIILILIVLAFVMLEM